MRLLFLLTCLFAQGFANDCCPCDPPSLCEEQALLNATCQQNERLYHSLDCVGKCRAIVLFQESGCPNCAIETAACEMAERQKNEYPNQKTYKNQIQEESGQYLFNDRFGN